MDSRKLKSISLAKTGNLVDSHFWVPFSQLLQKHLCGNDIRVTVCTDEVKIAEPKDSPNIIKENYESLAAGHRGIAKTCGRIREHFAWKGLRGDVRNFIKFCEECQRKKLVRRKVKEPMVITDTPSKAFSRLEIDLVGPLPVTENGNKYILTWQCNLTKYSGAIPMSDIDSPAIAKAFSEDFICRFGCPEIVVTDQGANLISDIMKQIAKIFHIKQIKSTTFHPETIGSLERSHHTLVEYLRYYISATDWDDYLKYAMFSYNTSVHEATNFTPHELIFESVARIPSEFVNERVPRNYNLLLDELLNKLVNTQAMAAARLNIAKERSKQYYDRKLNIQHFKG